MLSVSLIPKSITISDVAEINDVAAETGMPMMRPMFLQWPDDKGCQGKDVEDQFM